jgi:hypothetical protein
LHVLRQAVEDESLRTVTAVSPLSLFAIAAMQIAKPQFAELLVAATAMALFCQKLLLLLLKPHGTGYARSADRKENQYENKL